MAGTKVRVRRFLVYYFFSTLALGLAGFLISMDRSFAGWAVGAVAVFIILAAFGIRLQLINHGSTHKSANVYWCIVVVPGVVLSAYLLAWHLQAMKKPTPRLSILLKIPDFPDFSLLLTNELLSYKQEGALTKVSVLGYLVLPVRSDDAAVTLSFYVLNHGSGTSDGAMVYVSSRKTLQTSSGPGWHNANIPIEESRTLARRLQNSQRLGFF